MIGERLGTRDREAGSTLMEVMAAMTLLTLFLSVFTASVIQIFHVSNRINGTIDSSDALNTTFAKLDKQVRYASQIDSPTSTALSGSQNVYWVEFANAATNTCYQLKLDQSTATLSERSWSPLTSAIFPSYRVLVTNVPVPAGQNPFTLLPTDAVHLRQRLALFVADASGPRNGQTTSQLSVTFTALNSSATSPTSTVCGGGEHA